MTGAPPSQIEQHLADLLPKSSEVAGSVSIDALIERAADRVERRRRRVLRSDSGAFHLFCETVLPDDDGRAARQAPIHLSWESHARWCDHRGLVPMTLALWGHGKSMQRAVARAAWMLVQDQSLKFLYVTNSDKNKADKTKDLANILSSDLYRLYFPEVTLRQPPAKYELHLLGKHAREGTPTWRAVTYAEAGAGPRCDVLDIDDPVDYRNSVEQPEMRDKVGEAVEGQWFGRLRQKTPGTDRAWVGYREMIGTRWHEKDYWNTVLDSPGYCTLIQAISPDNSEIWCAVVCVNSQVDLTDYPWAHDLAVKDFDPAEPPSDPPEKTPHVVRGYERGRAIGTLPTWDAGGWSKEALDVAERIRPRWHDMGRRQRPYSQREIVFPHVRNCYQYVDPPTKVPPGWRVACGVDLSSRKRRGNAIVVAMTDGHRRALCDVRLGNWSSPQLSKVLSEIDRVWRPELFKVENNGYQEALMEWARVVGATWGSRVQPFMTTGQNKYDPEAGIETMDIEYDAGIWIFPEKAWEGHDHSCDCAWCILMDRLETCTRSDLRAKTNDLDLIMAKWFCWSGLIHLSRGAAVDFIGMTEEDDREIDVHGRLFDGTGTAVDETDEPVDIYGLDAEGQKESIKQKLRAAKELRRPENVLGQRLWGQMSGLLGPDLVGSEEEGGDGDDDGYF